MRLPSLILGCAVAAALATPHGQPDAGAPDLGRHFREAGATGSILIVESPGGRRLEHDPAGNATGYLPASTFKVFNSMAALDARAVSGVDQRLKWDGVDRGRSSWNRDVTMREAIRDSVVWFYQEMARRIGRKRMQQLLDDARYGNRRIGDRVDDFWLRGDLRITPAQQVEFLERLASGTLPFSERAMALTREIMIRDRGEGWTLHAKTGWADGPDPDVGWFVGWVERKDRRHVFALRMDIARDEDAPLRERLARACLEDAGAFRPPGD